MIFRHNEPDRGSEVGIAFDTVPFRNGTTFERDANLNMAASKGLSYKLSVSFRPNDRTRDHEQIVIKSIKLLEEIKEVTIGGKKIKTDVTPIERGFSANASGGIVYASQETDFDRITKENWGQNTMKLTLRLLRMRQRS